MKADSDLEVDSGPALRCYNFDARGGAVEMSVIAVERNRICTSVSHSVQWSWFEAAVISTLFLSCATFLNVTDYSKRCALKNDAAAKKQGFETPIQTMMEEAFEMPKFCLEHGRFALQLVRERVACTADEVGVLPIQLARDAECNNTILLIFSGDKRSKARELMSPVGW